jgi:hypothetical protein
MKNLCFSSFHLAAVLGLGFTVSADSSTNFGIYLTSKAMDVWTTDAAQPADLSAIPLEDTPIIALSDVEYYDRSYGVLVIKEQTRKAIRERFADFWPPTPRTSPGKPLYGRTFVVVAGGERIFLGVLWSRRYGGVSVPFLLVDGPGVIASRYSACAWSDPRIAASLRTLKARDPDRDGSVEYFEGVPQLEDVISISLHAGNGWCLKIARDEDGELSRGPGIPGLASLPRGTFTFPDIYETIARAIHGHWPGGADYPFPIRFSTTTNPSRAFYIMDVEAVRKVFDTAKQHCTPVAPAGFEETWQNMAPFPK